MLNGQAHPTPHCKAPKEAPASPALSSASDLNKSDYYTNNYLIIICFLLSFYIVNL